MQRFDVTDAMMMQDLHLLRPISTPSVVTVQKCNKLQLRRLVSRTLQLSRSRKSNLPPRSSTLTRMSWLVPMNSDDGTTWLKTPTADSSWLATHSKGVDVNVAPLPTSGAEIKKMHAAMRTFKSRFDKSENAPDFREDRIAFMMGLHPTYGEKSSMQSLVKSPIFDLKVLQMVFQFYDEWPDDFVC